VVVANVLVKRELNWLERLARYLGVKVQEQEQEYGLTWSSRRVVKGVNGESKDGYIHGNVVFCCSRINMMKNNMTLDEMREWTPGWYQRVCAFFKRHEEATAA
jgi:CTP:phosphocholine cytidylyltransferase-like protein